MIIFIVGVLLIVYSIVAKKKYSLAIGMFAVLLIMGFQEGIPGDYMGYKKMFDSANTGYGSSIKDTELSFLWAFRYLPRVMNFHVFVFLSSILQCLIMGLLIKRYANKKDQYFGVLVLFFTFNIMLLQMKAMRQAYAIDALVFAYILLDKKKYFLSLLVVVVAYGFHNSSIIAIAFFLILFLLKIVKKNEHLNKVLIDKRRKSLIPLIIVGVLVVVYIVRYTFFASYIEPFLMANEVSDYDFYLTQFDGEGSFIPWWLMLYYIVSTYVVALYLCAEDDQFKKYMAMLVIVGNLIAVFVHGYGNLQRINAYFIIFSIVVFPNVADIIRKKYGSQMALLFVVFNMLALMRVTVPMMFSNDQTMGTGFATYTFSFLK